jgi:hypothetical protein
LISLDEVVDEDSLNANSMLCFTNGVIALNVGSDKRNAMSAGKNGRNKIECEVDELGEIDTLLPRGLCDRRLGDGVSGGLPGSDGAHTICSGVIESPLTDKFSFPSAVSNSMRNCSADITDESDRLRSLELGDVRLTDKSSGVDVSRLNRNEFLKLRNFILGFLVKFLTHFWISSREFIDFRTSTFAELLFDILLASPLLFVLGDDCCCRS